MSRDQRDFPSEGMSKGLEDRLRSHGPPEVPDHLLGRCLSTLDDPRPQVIRPRWSGLRKAVRLAGSIAAVLLIGVLILSLRQSTASAAHFLQAVRSTWTEVPACHRVMTMEYSGTTRTMETWFVRGKGGRHEVHTKDGLTAVVVNNGRWEFRWDIAARLAAAWSTAFANRRSEFDSAGLVHENQAMVEWAQKHLAEIKTEPDTIGGRPVNKVTIKWPGAGGVAGQPQTDVVWFDQKTPLPIKQRSELWDGGVVEVTLDYPQPEAIPADLFEFKIPDDVTLEINDPDLGRQIYSEPRIPSSSTAETRKRSEP